MAEQNETAKRLERKYKLIAYGILTAIIVGMAIWLTSCMAGTPESPEEKATQDQQSKEITALVCAESVLEEYLISPASADFPLYDESMVINNGLQYTVDSYVDAENAFGASLRNNYTVVLEFENEDMESYKTLYVELDGEVYVDRK